MVSGGEPARPRAVLSIAIGGALIVSIAWATRCMPPIPPGPPPLPDPVVDAAEPDPAPEAGGDIVDPWPCEFVGPRARGGKRKETRIVGGKPATLGAFPFAAALASSSGHQYCGASVIGDRYALTAAHCQAEVGDRVLVGANDLAKARHIAIVESRIHPRFDASTLDYDAAIAVLASDAGVPAVPIARGVTSLETTVIGWGATCEGCAGTSQLREVGIDLVDHAKCSALLGTLTSRQVCAGKLEGGKDSCQGDSGGSLLTWNVDHWEQLGVVSWGVGCARPNAPGVYADLRAAELRRWVEACSR
jgi:secreted trypsin-like serine protease